MVPSAARPDRSLLRAAFALSSTATRASPLRVRGGITRDRALSTCRCAELVGEIGFLVAGGGEGPCTRPRARYPPSPRGVVAGRVGLEGRRWAPGPTRLPVSPVPSVACASLLRASTSRPLSRRGRVACGACRVLSGVCGCRLVPPPSTAAFPRPVEIAGALLPPLPPPRGSRGSVNRGVWPRSRGRTSYLGEPAVGRVRRVVGRWDPLPGGGLRRLASASASVLSRVGWRLLGLPGVSVGFGSARCRGRGGTAPGWVQCDSRRFGSRARSPPERPPGPL